MDHIIYLALGSNLGNREINLKAATNALMPAVMVLAESPIYETTPWGGVDQSDYLNMVFKGKTNLEPLALLTHLKYLETQLGRTPSVRYGPRMIDLDILFYDDTILYITELTIPHPHLHERAFVLVPLADLAPNLVHPVIGKTVRELLTAVDVTGVKRYG
ncbi:MAG: 2-amino-4-hydroxy-6-hydroxymethyldihydropteridine diphosphokinase [Chloroflexota bacterium]